MMHGQKNIKLASTMLNVGSR